MRQTKYKILGKDSSLSDTEGYVNNYLKEGWEILTITIRTGGILVHLIKNNCESEKE